MEGALPNYDSSISVDFPDDCLACIFSHIRREDLPKVMLVCHRFFDVVNSSSFFLEFCHAHGYTLPSLEWRKFANSQNRHFDFRVICEGFNPYGSICPEDYFLGRLSADELNWGKQRTFNATDQFGPFRRICRRLARETPPLDLRRESDVPSRFRSYRRRVERPLVEHAKFDTCLATSAGYWGIRTYEIDLIRLGIEEWVLDSIRPRIIIEEWSAPRFHCDSEYRLAATLLKNGEEYSEDQLYPSGRRKQLRRVYEQGAPSVGFERNELVLDNYSSGVRTLIIKSKGKTRGPLRGNNGSKFAGLTIRCELPSKLEFVDLEIPDSESQSTASEGYTSSEDETSSEDSFMEEDGDE